MGTKMKVYVNDKESGGRKLIDCELMQKRVSSVIVKLPDGNIILRKRRDIPKENHNANIQ